MAEPVPTILGRFNYLSFKMDCYNVMFVPFRGSNACIIARNLSKEDALALIEDFNHAIDETRKDIANAEEESLSDEM